MKTNLIFFILIPIFLLVSCKNTPEVVKQELHSFDSVVQESTDDKVPQIVLNVDPSESELADNGLYRVAYQVNFSINSKGTFSCSLYDTEGTVVYTAENQRLTRTGKNSITFYDYVLYDTLSYQCTVVSPEGETAVYTGKIDAPVQHTIERCVPGPIMSELSDGKKETSLFVDCSISSPDDAPVFVHLIPPTEDFFWDIPVDLSDDGKYSAFSKIKYSSHPEFIDNGTYILQVSFGKWGIVQKNIAIQDLYKNQDGPNYGFLIPAEIKSNKDTIQLDIDNPSLIETLELVMYRREKNRYNQIGTFHSQMITDTLSKKMIFETLRDENELPVKLKYNKEYYYQIVLHSREIGTIRYISVSDKYRIVFYGFNLLTF